MEERRRLRYEQDEAWHVHELEVRTGGKVMEDVFVVEDGVEMAVIQPEKRVFRVTRCFPSAVAVLAVALVLVGGCRKNVPPPVPVAKAINR
jgi:hypothetical protein